MLEDYASGMTVAQVARKHGISVGKAYYELKEAGCQFRRKGVPIGYKHSKEACRKIGDAHRGKHLTDATKAKIALFHKQGRNGLNGYGHTKKHANGYVVAYAPDHPHAHRDGYVLLHRIIAEQQIGRYLADNECVHHINHVRDDNRPENLCVMDKHEHQSMHSTENHRR